MLTFIEGNSVDLEVTVTLEDEPYDLTNHKAWFTVKADKSLPDSSAIIQVTTNDSIVFMDAAAGKMLISLEPEVTNVLPTNTPLYCDIQIRDEEGDVYTLLFEDIIVTKRVTEDLDYA